MHAYIKYRKANIKHFLGDGCVRAVLISSILALGMTRVLGGIGEMLQARSLHRIYWGARHC